MGLIDELVPAGAGIRRALELAVRDIEADLRNRLRQEVSSSHIGELALPWHDGGRGAPDPADAVAEFVEFAGFAEPVELVGLPGSGADGAHVEIRPRPVSGSEGTAPLPSEVGSPTIAVLSLTSPGVQIFEHTPVIAIEPQPVPRAA